MRTYLAATRDDLERLVAGEAVVCPAFTAASDDEEDEFDALARAATADVVVVADLPAAEEPVTLDLVQALHVDVDGSGDLAWYATQEADEVLAVLRAR